VLIAMLACGAQARAADAGASLSGRVTGTPLEGATVYALNTDRNVGYMVYVVEGRYRAARLLPGRYEITLRHGRSIASPAAAARVLTIAAGQRAVTDFEAQRGSDAGRDGAGGQADYVGGMTYPDATVEPYDAIYPPGPGRDILERTCMGCHTVQLFAYNRFRTYPTGRLPKDAEGWAITVDRMHRSPAFSVPGRSSYFDAALLPPGDRDLLVAYLTKHFPADAPPRAVAKPGSADPPLDPRALAKAMIVEYRFPNTEAMPARFTQQIDFDRDGNVWVTDRGAPALVKVDPRTGERTDYTGHGGGHGLAVDLDGTIWYSGPEVVRRFDPRTERHDAYVIDGDTLPGSNTQIFDSRGNLWLSLLTTGELGLWDRRTDTIRRWRVPIERSRPYGIIVDHRDRVWWAGYHDSGVDMFDPATGAFRHFRITNEEPTNIRRPGVDSRGHIWVPTWGSPGMMNGSLYRLDPDSGAVLARPLGIPYANPYCSEVDEFDRVWVSTDNYLVRYDPEADRFTYFPLPTRTDVPKVTIARGGAVWFTPRNAGQSGDYGGAASVLYPDMDRFDGGGAYFHPSSAAARLALHRGRAAIAVAGVIKASPKGYQNEADPPAPTAPIILGPIRQGAREQRLE
jgi:streptogramin lyase